MKKIGTVSLKLFLVGLGISSPFLSYASGTYIPLQSIADLGTAFAGSAAGASQDASTNYTNPAALVLIPNKQLVIGASFLSSTIKFSGSAGSRGLITPYSQSGNASSDTAGIIPAFHFAYPLSDKWYAGVSIHSPYGLGVDYSNSILQYNIVDATSVSSELSPSLAYKFNDQLSAGFGPDVLYMSLKESYAVYLNPLSTQDGVVNAGAKGVGYGWHAGLLYQFTPETRVGLAYHSQIAQTLRGYNDFIVNQGPYAGFYSSHRVKGKITLPPLTTLSIYHQLNPLWALLGSIEYAQWGVYKDEILYNFASFAGKIPMVTVPRDWHNTWRFAIGTNYKLTQKWLLRFGLNYEQSPTDNLTRDAIFPDSNHITLGIGTRYQLSKDVKIDFAYAHLFYEKAKLQYTSPIAGGSTINGDVHSFNNVFGLQIIWNL